MEKIKIAVDSCVIIMLSKLANPNLCEKDKIVKNCVKNRVLKPELYDDTPYEYLPPLLKDKYFGAVARGDDGERYYTNLIDMCSLLNKVEKGYIELYMTPTVFGELDFDWYQEQSQFINKYVKIVQLEPKQEKQFYRERNALARSYVTAGAMAERFSASERKKVPQNDAYIMAEASLCGLVLITANSKDFINFTRWDDYQRCNAIQRINTDAGLVFESNIPKFKIAPYPMSVNSFVLKSRFIEGFQQKGYYIPKPKIYGKVYQPELTK